ncbi:tyrosine-type recombinase/integrase [Halopenitus sp. POP-27]|uniref:tyrosine-type recombinase/integrase n=1 Tax=Halopenitus sp. POP-27 TaxID=2994425 RepID=UPI002468ECFE|nr:tyrosine-type recombinase/integrase [Halopenitus sp. POP-27]
MNTPQVVSEWLEDKELMYDSKASYKKRQSDVRQFLKWLDSNNKAFVPIERDRHKSLIHRYFLSLKDDGYARNTMKSRWDSIKLLYDDLAGFHSVIDETPFEDLYERSHYLPDKTREETESEKPYVTREQKEILCNNVASPAFRNECMIRLMWHTALREGEVAELKVSDVNLAENKLDEFWSPKIGTERTVTFKPSLNWWLNEWINGGYRESYTKASESDYLFLTHRSEKFPRDRPNKVIKKAASEGQIQSVRKVDTAGREIHEITSHAIRRGHAMHLLKNDVDLRTIQKRLGHAKLDTTIEYLPISPEDTSDKIEGIQF